MRKSFLLWFMPLSLLACKHKAQPIVDPAYVDSLISNYRVSQRALVNDSNLAFWKRRLSRQPDNFVNGPEYASALSSNFHLYGDMSDLIRSDSLWNQSNISNQQSEPGIFRTLASLAMLRHRFVLADSFLHKAIKLEGLSDPNAFLDFDISFERGQYKHAKSLLDALRRTNSYAYLFRMSKYEHYSGSLDSSISYMHQASEKALNNKYLAQVALSNTADLYIHKGDLSKAYELYKQCIRIDGADFHSIIGIGWLALVHDKNAALATKLFDFVSEYYHSPEPLLKLEQAAEERNDTSRQLFYAKAFESMVTDSAYGNMYSKYLIDLYTGILNEPRKAEVLAQQEIVNRPTPQVYAWYVWSLYCNNEKEKAYAVFKQTVSGKPLEGPELYYMGKMMQGLNKGYNAQQFLSAAHSNRYDLSPSKIRDLENSLE